MKFSSIATSLLSLASPPQADVRKSTKAQVIVHGVKSAFTDEDLAIINESAIAAYKTAQKKTSYVLEETKPIIHFGFSQNDLKQGCQLCPPDDDSFLADLKQGCQLCPPDDDGAALGSVDSANALLLDVTISGLKQGCQLCPPDDDAVELDTTISHVEFVDTFCGLLANSGSSNLQTSHSCSFSFLEEPAHKISPLTLVKRSEDETALGYFTVSGLVHDLSAKDLSVIEKAARSTYNEAFSGLFSVESLRTRGAVKTPKSNKNLEQGCQLCPPDDDSLKQGCQLCPPDDDSFLTHGVANIVLLDAKVAGLSQGCQLCPPDDDAMAATLESHDLKKINQAFGKALCAKLRNSGRANLASAENCAMDFFYEHAAEVGEEQA